MEIVWLSFWIGFGVSYGLAGLCFYYLMSITDDPEAEQLLANHPVFCFLLTTFFWPVTVIYARKGIAQRGGGGSGTGSY